MESFINIVAILFVHTETVVFLFVWCILFWKECLQKSCFFSNLFFCYLSMEKNILYYSNLLQRTIIPNKTRRPYPPSANLASCLVASFEPCCVRNFIIHSINEALNTTMQILRIVIRLFSVCFIAKYFHFHHCPKGYSVMLSV